MSNIVAVGDLVKTFGEVRAVDGVSFEVGDGEIFGFLGPNGAGKTTTIRIMVALLHRTSGEVEVAGFDPERRPAEVRRRIGYAAQAAALDDELTGFENLHLIGRLQGLGRSEARSRAEELMTLLDLTEAAKRRAGTYSGGMRRRLDLAGALVHRPPLLILDEPTSGLDPQTRLALWGHLESLRRQGATIFLTTQYLEEVDRLADRVAIIDRGQIVAMGTPLELKAEIGADAISIALHETETRDVLIGKIEEMMSGLAGLAELRHDQDSVTVYVRDGARSLADVVRRLDGAGMDVRGITLSTPSLDDVFLKHTGSRMRVEEVKPPARGFSRRRERR